MRKITVLDFANQIGVLSDEVPVVVKTDRKVGELVRLLSSDLQPPIDFKLAVGLG